MKNRKTILLVVAAFLMMTSGLAWFSYVGQGIAYGDLVGIRGRESDLASIGRGAMEALWVGVSCEAMGIGLIGWALADRDSSIWGRSIICSGLALFGDVFTYVLVRSL